jgi:hypothetical protein
VGLSQQPLAASSVRLPARGGLRPTPANVLRHLVVLSLGWAMVSAATVCSAQEQTDEQAVINHEYAIKAAYLYHFGGYVEWPASAFPTKDTPLVIGVLGTNPFGDTLDEIVRTKKVAGHSIVAKVFASMAAYTPCHILFVHASTSPEEMATAIRAANGLPVLLVGENPGFIEQGGTINFFIEENKVRFEINVDIAKRQHLKISSKLLGLAKIAQPQQP